jgi:hypothetical protein
VTFAWVQNVVPQSICSQWLGCCTEFTVPAKSIQDVGKSLDLLLGRFFRWSSLEDVPFLCQTVLPVSAWRTGGLRSVGAALHLAPAETTCSCHDSRRDDARANSTAKVILYTHVSTRRGLPESFKLHKHRMQHECLIERPTTWAL